MENFSNEKEEEKKTRNLQEKDGNFKNLVFAESSGIADPFEELPTCSVLHYNSQMRWCQNHLQNKLKNKQIK